MISFLLNKTPIYIYLQISFQISTLLQKVTQISFKSPKYLDTIYILPFPPYLCANKNGIRIYDFLAIHFYEISSIDNDINLSCLSGFINSCLQHISVFNYCKICIFQLLIWNKTLRLETSRILLCGVCTKIKKATYLYPN